MDRKIREIIACPIETQREAQDSWTVEQENSREEKMGPQCAAREI